MQQTTPLQAIISALTPLLVFHDSAMILFCGGLLSPPTGCHFGGPVDHSGLASSTLAQGQHWSLALT